jgi:hypothetical protein
VLEVREGATVPAAVGRAGLLVAEAAPRAGLKPAGRQEAHLLLAGQRPAPERVAGVGAAVVTQTI